MSPVVSAEIVAGALILLALVALTLHLRAAPAARLRRPAHALRAPGATGGRDYRLGLLRFSGQHARVVHPRRPLAAAGPAVGAAPPRARPAGAARPAVAGLPEAVTVDCHYGSDSFRWPWRRGLHRDAQLARELAARLQRQRRLSRAPGLRGGPRHARPGLPQHVAAGVEVGHPRQDEQQVGEPVEVRRGEQVDPALALRAGPGLVAVGRDGGPGAAARPAAPRSSRRAGGPRRRCRRGG